ncbi:MAG: hypothetical protein ABI407_11485 [Bradyrhizobium sp.]
MLLDATWQQLAKKHETLCAKCTFDRARKRRVNLTFDDLLPCVSNLAGPWFDLFRGAEPPDRPVLSERAYAWQHAMLLVRANQIHSGLPARDLPNMGKVLAVDRRTGLTLREAPEGGIHPSDGIDWANGEKYLKAYESDGDLAVEIFISFESDNTLRLKEIFAPRGPGSLGIGKTRSVFRLLQQAYPNIETISGFRTTGARLKKPMELKSSLDCITGITNAIRAIA